MAATTISAAMRTMTIHSRYSPVGREELAQNFEKFLNGWKTDRLTMSMRQLVFQYLQEICNDVQPLGQQADSLVHF